MQACPANPHQQPPAVALPPAAQSQSQARALPASAMTLISFTAAMLIAASSSATTPLYHLYQQSMHLTPFWITVVFASMSPACLPPC